MGRSYVCLIVAIEEPYQLGVSFDPGSYPKRYIYFQVFFYVFEIQPRILRRTASWQYVLFQVPFGAEEGSGFNQHLAPQSSLYFSSLPCWIRCVMWKEKFGKLLFKFWTKIIVGKKWCFFFFSSKPALSCLNGIFFSPHGLDYWTSDQRRPHETPAAIDASDCLYFEIVSQDPWARAFLVCLEQPFEIWAHQTISLLALVM